MKFITQLTLIFTIVTSVSFAKGSRTEVAKKKIHSFERKLRFYTGSDKFLSRAFKLHKSILKSIEFSKKSKKWLKVTEVRKKWFTNYEQYWNQKFRKNFKNMDLTAALAWWSTIKQVKALTSSIEKVKPPKLDRKEEIQNRLRKRFPVLQQAIDASEEVIELDNGNVSGL